MAEQEPTQAIDAAPDGGFRGRVSAAIAEPRHSVMCINALAARVDHGGFSVEDAREVRALVMQEIRATKGRIRRAWVAFFAKLEGTDVKAIAELLRAEKEPTPAQHLHLHGELASMNANELRAYVASRLAVRAEPPDGNREG